MRRSVCVCVGGGGVKQITCRTSLGFLVSSGCNFCEL